MTVFLTSVLFGYDYISGAKNTFCNTQSNEKKNGQIEILS